MINCDCFCLLATVELGSLFYWCFSGLGLQKISCATASNAVMFCLSGCEMCFPFSMPTLKSFSLKKSRSFTDLIEALSPTLFSQKKRLILNVVANHVASPHPPTHPLPRGILSYRLLAQSPWAVTAGQDQSLTENQLVMSPPLLPLPPLTSITHLIDCL